MATIGLRDVYVAELLMDPIGGVPTYAIPKRVAGAISANVNPNATSATLFYDDGPGDVAATLGEITVEMNLADIPLPIQAFLFGHTYTQGILRRKGADTPPWVALGYRSLKSTGGYIYQWLLKGKFQVSEQINETKGDAITFNTPTITGSFAKRDSDDQWQILADSDDLEFNLSYITEWFNTPNVLPGSSASGMYGSTRVAVTAAAARAGATIILRTGATAGAAWLTNTLTITMLNAVVYTAAQLQNLIDAATGTAPGPVNIRTSAAVTGATGVELTLVLAI